MKCDELTAYKGDVTIPVYGTIADAEVYLKEEADKVIADLEMKLAAAKLVLRLNEPKALYSNLDTMSRLNHKIDVAERRELHQKYKRCFAMAERCKYRMYYLAAVVEQEASKIIPLKAQIQWYQKRENRMNYWKNRWLELAEQFKEAK